MECELHINGHQQLRHFAVALRSAKQGEGNNRRGAARIRLRIESCRSVTQGEEHFAGPKGWSMEFLGKTGRNHAFILTFLLVLTLCCLLGCGLNPQRRFAGLPADTSSTSTTSSPAPATGNPGVAHSVQLSWAQSNSIHVLGYSVYRRAQADKQYVKLNPALLANPDYLDTSVQGGQTYYYVVTASTAMAESASSPEVVAVIPAS